MIDFNAHIGTWPGIFGGFGKSALRGYMDSAGIDRAVVSRLDDAFGRPQSPDTDDDLPSWLIPFQSVGTGCNLDQLADKQARGIRIYPTYQKWDFDGESFADLIDLALSRSWIVQVYLRLLDPRALAQIEDPASVLKTVEPIIGRYTDMQFVITGITLPEVTGNEGLFGKSNIWCDISHIQHPMNSITKLLQSIDASRVLLGTNTPFFYPYAGVYHLEKSNISEADKAKILNKNAQALLGTL